jgi:hypothetical protein
MGAKRIIWHVGLGRLLRRRGPRCFEIREEVPLSDEPARVDYLILRKLPGSSVGDDHAETLSRLWPLLPLVTVLEYKSPGRPYRRATSTACGATSTRTTRTTTSGPRSARISPRSWSSLPGRRA